MKDQVILICISLTLISICSAQNSRVENWNEDINYYHKALEKNHIDLYHTISKNEFNSEVLNIKEKLPNLKDFQVIVELMRLTYKIGGGKGDGHTSVPLWGMDLHKYPIKLFDFGNEIRVIEADENHKYLIGKKIISIDGIPIDIVYSKVSELTPFTENKQSSMDRTCNYMIISEVLEAIGIVKTKEKAKFTFIDDNGIEDIKTLNSYSKVEFDNFEFETAQVSNTYFQRAKDSKFKDLWFASLNNSKTVYIKFGEYPSEKEMNDFSEGVYNFIEQTNSESLIIDLRNNYGGDFFIGQILASWLNACDSIIWKSNVYVLINRVTYSAAMVNALQFKQLLNAKIIGEPTGANPNGYQDLGQFKLPNSDLTITYTKRLFRLQDIDSKGLQPDVLIRPKWDNYKKGVDEVLYWVLNDIKN